MVKWWNGEMVKWCDGETMKWIQNLPIPSGKDILGPRGTNISFPHNLTKKYYFQNFELFLIRIDEIFPKRQ